MLPCCHFRVPQTPAGLHSSTVCELSSAESTLASSPHSGCWVSADHHILDLHSIAFRLAVSLIVLLLGLINNVLYVVILSAALDLVGPSVPKGVVLLADVVPSFITKLCAPYFIHAVPYPVRVVIFVALSAFGMLLIALSPAYDHANPAAGENDISTKLVGVMLASLSSGAGELSFLGLTHFYGPFSLAAWGSGTGAAGLVGAGAYALATTSFGFSVKTTLLVSACLPAVMLVSFFIILPLGPLRRGALLKKGYEAVLEAESGEGEGVEPERRFEGDPRHVGDEREGLLGASVAGSNTVDAMPARHSGWDLFKINLRRARGLFFPL